MLRSGPIIGGLLSILLAVGAASPAAAQAYPSRPVRLLVPFPPGGPTDLVSRVVAAAMSVQLGQPIIVDNRPGANGNIAHEAAAKAEPDGYTILYSTTAAAISEVLYPKLGYDLRRDFTPLGLTATVPLVLVVNPGLPAKTVGEFIAYAQAHPGELSYASTGIGGVTHLGAILFLKSNGLDALHVPFRGSAPGLTAVAGNHVQFMTDTVNSAHPLINGGQLRGLAVMGARRVAVLPDVPTLAESGLKDFEIGSWQGLMAPAATPAPIVARLNAAALAALEDPNVKEKLTIQGASIIGSSPTEHREFISSEIARWTIVVKESGAKAE